jgi:hypothetical protein
MAIEAGTGGHVYDDGSGGRGLGGAGGSTAGAGGAGGGIGGNGPRDGAAADRSLDSAEASEEGGPWLALPAVAPALVVPARAALKLHLHGSGTQVYTCSATASGSGTDGGVASYAWILKAPDAKLFGEDGELVGHHGAGPSWTSKDDGSSVTGVKAMQGDAPETSAIPWLLLRASSTSGAGIFSDVTYVQRLLTKGGRAPVSGCDATTVAAETAVEYSAEYYFYTGGAGADWLLLPAGLPSAIAAPSGATVKVHDRGLGAQVYTCTASNGADAGVGSFAWVLKAPDAILYDASYAQVGSHGAGPRWISVDGSEVAATKVGQASAPRADAIPWLLLAASSTGGTGTFGDIAFVLRLNTAGGVAPGDGCGPTTVGAETRVSYSADYYFLVAGPDGGATD